MAWDPSCASILNEEAFNDPTAIPDPVEENQKVIRDINNFYWIGKSDLDR
ncbi:MAG: hypothetical protein R2860_10470 [Desulfobacterales bacterium]